MTLSANEIYTLAAKAARGAGAEPGQAEDFGRAACYHFAARRPIEELLQALALCPRGPISQLPTRLMRIVEGGRDGIAGADLSLSDVSSLFLSYIDALPYHVALHCSGDLCAVSIHLTQPNRAQKPGRAAVPPHLKTRLNQLAEKTLVPETRVSREKGAGASLYDSD